MWFDTDVRDVLPTVHVPTAVLYKATTRSRDPRVDGLHRRAHPGAAMVAVPGRRLSPGSKSPTPGLRHRALPRLGTRERRTSTACWPPYCSPTSWARRRSAAEIGDAHWKELLERHGATVRALLARYRGTEVKTMGDGFLATFDGPARAVRCAQGICEAVKPLGLEVRAGCHTGEIELMGADVGGIAVHIGARVGALAKPSEVLVSSTVKDLVAGSGLRFTDRGEHELKGVPGSWRLYAAEPAAGWT